ncbi:uncharacterized protein Z520_04351 [Fonsecaea multimorphosa CBS 102226]|uniref:VOC domain-containing protein n=1 Tax=Fonsecaea multimorphosa CBS 102226 TaxID=1442371 RepID=A0A0D2HCU1_9EURO|nr:uncharacterized protein Z520_04351 [Fonsecaea multimorphosa CBS 102226]KIX99715.1 hypothetical protein Z520_04351 [Fonsecaea multimorphosa CBS 102226]OAL26763.1 hypothetical protein AYO22_04116 [Fonsecaea multimorphosa]
MATTQRPYNVLSPWKLAHIVLRTARFTEMVDFYKRFLGAEVEFENDRACFLRYDDEHHRLGIITYDGLTDDIGRRAAEPGLEHIAFTFHNLNDLVTVWEQRKALGIEPVWCVNHGATTSMYYADPDGNKLESQVDNFDDPDEQRRFLTSTTFRENPVGTDFDPEELKRRVNSGEDHASIKRRIEIGPRPFPTMVGARP